MCPVIMDKDSTIILAILYCRRRVLLGCTLLLKDTDWVTRDSQQQIGHCNVLGKVAVKYFFNVLSMNLSKRKESTNGSIWTHHLRILQVYIQSEQSVDS